MDIGYSLDYKQTLGMLLLFQKQRSLMQCYEK